MPTPFLQWKETDGREAIASATPSYMNEVRDFLCGDHFRNGAGWIGPRPDVGDPDYRAVMTVIEDAFTSRNVLEEVTDRRTNGVVGKDSRWRYTTRRLLRKDEKPADTEVADIAFIEGEVLTWWDRNKVAQTLKDATRNAVAYERGPIRFRIPRGLLTTRNGINGLRIARGDLRGALRRIFIESVDPAYAVVYRDDDTMQEVTVCIERDAKTGAETMELTFLDGSGTEPELTIKRRIAPDGTVTTSTFNLGGELTMHEVRCPRFISTQMIQGQKALNLSLTVIPRTVVTAGWLERALLNAQLPGYYEDVKGEDGKTVGRRFIPQAPEYGGSTTAYYQAQEIDEDDGHGGTKTGAIPADIKWRDPVDPKFAIVGKVSHYQDILEEADQAHILIQSDATPSGHSREMARAEFEGSLNEVKPAVDEAGRWILNTVLAFAEFLAGVPGKYTTKYRAEFEANIDTGPLTPDEKRFNLEAMKDGAMSVERCMELNGTTDVDAEKHRIAAEGFTNLGRLEKVSTIVANFAKANIPVGFLFQKLLGMSEADAAELQAQVDDAKQKELDAQTAQVEAQAKAKASAAPPTAGPSANAA